jgi:hypothetical protein
MMPFGGNDSWERRRVRGHHVTGAQLQSQFGLCLDDIVVTCAAASTRVRGVGEEKVTRWGDS